MTQNKVFAVFFASFSLVALVFFPLHLRSDFTTYAADSVFFEDDLSSINTNEWVVNENDGTVSIDNDKLVISSTSQRLFPYVHSKNDVFPSYGNFSLLIRFRYRNITDWGNGIWIGDYVMQNNILAFSPDWNYFVNHLADTHYYQV